MGRGTCECVALLRGINVGKAKRIAMADLRRIVEDLGFTNVRTLLNSGNVVFSASRPSAKRIASAIEAAIEKRCGFSSRVVVVRADELAQIVANNPLSQVATDASRFLVAFSASPQALKSVEPLLKQSWTPDRLAIVGSAAYLWCADGLIESKLVQTFMRAAGDSATTRNWATVLKLRAMTEIGAGRRNS